MKQSSAWKRREMRICNKPMADLAAAVIRQWRYDGKPKNDMDSINCWRELIAVHQQIMSRSFS